MCGLSLTVFRAHGVPQSRPSSEHNEQTGALICVHLRHLRIVLEGCIAALCVMDCRWPGGANIAIKVDAIRLGVVNSYLIRDRAAILIDCGMPGSAPAIHRRSLR